MGIRKGRDVFFAQEIREREMSYVSFAPRMNEMFGLKFVVSAMALCLMMVGPASGAFIDGFEGYSLGNLAGQAGVDGNVWVDFGGAKLTVVSNARAHSGSKSMMQELNFDGGYGSDIILQFGNAVTDAVESKWTFSMWQFIESDENFDGMVEMYLSRDVIQITGTGYAEGSWMVADGGTGRITHKSGSPSLPILVKNQWVELRWDIDFENNEQKFYYDDTHVMTSDWVPSGQSGNRFSSLNFWVNDGATSNSRVYVDDFSLQVTVAPEPASVTLAVCGLLGLLGRRRRR